MKNQDEKSLVEEYLDKLSALVEAGIDGDCLDLLLATNMVNEQE